LEKAKATLRKIKNYDVEANVPEEIREDEAHLTHIMTVKTSPNMRTMEFEHVTKIHKLNDQAFAAIKEQIRTGEETIVFLHDGNEYVNSKGKTAEKKEATPDVDEKDAQIEKLQRELEEFKRNSASAEFADNSKSAAGTNLDNKGAEEGKQEGTAATTTNDLKGTENVDASKPEGLHNSDAANTGKKAAEASKAGKVENK
jgi:hypothetical protein